MSIINDIDTDLQSAIDKTKYLLENLYNQNSKLPMELEVLEKKFYANALFDKIEMVEQILDTYEKLRNKNKTLLDSKFCNINNESSEIQMEYYKETSNNLEQFTELSKDEIKKLKVGALILYIIKKMSSEKKFSKTNIINLQNKEWCKEIFLVNHPIIKKYNKYLTETDQRKISGSNKYYSSLYVIDKSEYFVCSELSDRSRLPLLQWFYGKYKISIKNENRNCNSIEEEMGNIALIRYNYDELRNITNSSNKPCKVVISNRETIVNSWSEIIVAVCEFMISLDSYSMSKIVNESQFRFKNRHVFSLDPTILEQPKKLSNGLYVETAYSSEKIVRYCYSILCYCEVDSELLEIYSYKEEKRGAISQEGNEEDSYNGDVENLTLENMDSELVNEFIKILDIYDYSN